MLDSEVSTESHAMPLFQPDGLRIYLLASTPASALVFNTQVLVSQFCQSILNKAYPRVHWVSSGIVFGLEPAITAIMPIEKIEIRIQLIYAIL